MERNEATGARTTYAYSEGVIDISGNIKRYWTGSGTDAWSTGAGGTGSLTTYYIGIYPNGAVSGQPYIAIDTVKFGKVNKSHRPGAVLMLDTIDFMGSREYTGSVP